MRIGIAGPSVLRGEGEQSPPLEFYKPLKALGKLLGWRGALCVEIGFYTDIRNQDVIVKLKSELI